MASMDSRTNTGSTRMVDFQWQTEPVSDPPFAAVAARSGDAGTGGGMVKNLKLSTIYHRFAAIQPSQEYRPASVAAGKAEVIDEVLEYQIRSLDRRAQQLSGTRPDSTADETIAALIELRIASLDVAATFQKLAEDTAELLAQGLLEARK